jgi:hypothetical protein
MVRGHVVVIYWRKRVCIRLHYRNTSIATGLQTVLDGECRCVLEFQFYCLCRAGVFCNSWSSVLPSVVCDVLRYFSGHVTSGSTDVSFCIIYRSSQ